MLKNNQYILTYSICSFLCFIFIFGLFFNSIPDNPIKLKMNIDNKIFTFVPQGWAFFTRSPTEAQITIYEINSKNELTPIKHRHSEINNLFGLNRRTAKIFSELQFIKSELNEKLYFNTEWNYQDNKYSKIPIEINIVKNKFKDPILIGNYLIIYQNAVPWAWKKSSDKILMPAKMIRLKIV